MRQTQIGAESQEQFIKEHSKPDVTVSPSNVAGEEYV
jgi:hypothetical protein